MTTLLIPPSFGFSLFVITLLASSFGLHDDLPLLDQVWVLVVQTARHRKVCELGRLAEDIQAKTLWNPGDLLIEGPVED